MLRLIIICHSDKNPDIGGEWKGPQRINDIALGEIIKKAGWNIIEKKEVMYDDNLSERKQMYAHLFIAHVESDVQKIVKSHAPPDASKL